MDEQEEFIGINEAAQVLKLTPHYIKQLCREGRIPHYQPRPFAHYRFLVSELRAYLRGDS